MVNLRLQKLLHTYFKKNKFKVKLGGNIGTPVLNLNVRQDTFFIIEASHFNYRILNLYTLIMHCC